jgi:putative nucleotidyltransferase with HDIG domain
MTSTATPLPQSQTNGAAAARLTEAEILVAARALGPSGAAGARLVASLLDPDLILGELARRIESQPAIAARVLRVANSAYFGFAGTVSTLDRAVQVLGLSSVKGAAAAACMDRMVTAGPGASAFNIEQFRLHSLAVAQLAAVLAQEVTPALAEEAFMAGLLHDLGVVIQWRLRPQGLSQLLQGPVATDPSITDPEREEAEVRLVGASHTQCAGVVLRAWQLPGALVEAVVRHHGGDHGASPTLAALVAAADRLAAMCGFGLPSDGPADADGREMVRAWGVDDMRVDAMMARLPDQVAALSVAFGH